MLAGTLGMAGLHLGRVLDAPFSLNPTGLQEPEALIWMHEHLLEANGGAWHTPPAKVVWGPLHRAVRDLFVESRAGRPLWGFKEPRTLLVVDGWIEALPAWTAIGIFRDPGEVAASLAQRNGFAPEKGLALWTAYNARLLALQRAHGFPLIEFTADADRMRQGLRRALAWLGLPEAAAERLFDADLPRHSGTAAAREMEAALPGSVADVLAGLRAAASR